MPYPTVMHSPNGSHVSRGPEVKGEREGQGEKKERSFLCLDSSDGTLRLYQHGSSLVDTATLCSVEMTRCERRVECIQLRKGSLAWIRTHARQMLKLSWCAISEELSWEGEGNKGSGEVSLASRFGGDKQTARFGLSLVRRWF